MKLVATSRKAVWSRLRVESPLGTLTLLAEAGALAAVLWPGEPEETTRLSFLRGAVFSDAPSPVPLEEGVNGLYRADPARDVLRATADQLAAYFSGSGEAFAVPLVLHGTPFQVRVWRALASIPFGRTASYGQLARELGCPRAARAVGAAVARNPVGIVLPCHRVLGADGSLTGFAGGLPAKEWLLRHEASKENQ